jgi:hypothetical protein
MKKRAKSRERAIAGIKEKLLWSGSPRLQVSVIIMLTAGAGFLTSFFLLQLEVYSMTVRYPLAVMVAYGFFLIFLKIWIQWQKSNQTGLGIDVSGIDVSNVDLSGISLSSGTGGSTDEADFEFGSGGDFGGGGAGGAWSGQAGGSTSSRQSVGLISAVSPAGSNDFRTDSGGSKNSDSSFLDGIDLDEGILAVLIIIAVTSALLAIFYIIYIAPVLLAEILFDGLIATGLYRHFKTTDRRYWLKTAVKKTILPALIITISAGVAGYAMQEIAPEARSVGGFLRQIF